MDWLERMIRFLSAAILPIALAGTNPADAQIRHRSCTNLTPSPPGQPADGPGSSDYLHGDVVQYQLGAGPTAYYLFEPTDPPAASAPVIVFLHGYGDLHPHTYGGWIRHLVRRGNVVVFPVYQTDFFAPAMDCTPNAVAGIADAFRALSAGGHVIPREGCFALAGHSAGGLIAANVAGRAVDAGLPSPQALYMVDAADTGFGSDNVNSIFEPDSYLRIPPETLVLAVLSDEDRLADPEVTLLLLRSLPQIATENKEIISLASDFHGCPNLLAGHLATAGNEAIVIDFRKPNPFQSRHQPRINAFEYYGYWKWLDAVTDAAFFGVNREYAFGDTSEQTFLGLWSDGRPVKPAQVVWP